MDYVPGLIHDFYQRSRYYCLLSDFSWINCNNDLRWNKMLYSKDWDNLDTIDLKVGDIIGIRYYKPSDSSGLYVYLDYVISGGVCIYYYVESIISKDFIDINVGIFSDITLSFNRDKKIGVLLDK